MSCSTAGLTGLRGEAVLTNGQSRGGGADFVRDVVPSQRDSRPPRRKTLQPDSVNVGGIRRLTDASHIRYNQTVIFEVSSFLGVSGPAEGGVKTYENTLSGGRGCSRPCHVSHIPHALACGMVT